MQVGRRSLLGTIVALYVAQVVVVAILIDRLGDVWWPATVLMFAPRWIWAVPLGVLVPLALRRGHRAHLVPLCAAAVVLLGPILDLRLPLQRLGRRGIPRDLRVMTFNMGGGHVDPAAIDALVAEQAPDVVAIQEREGAFVVGSLNMNCHIGMCLASRFPIKTIDRRDDRDLRAQHGSGGIMRYDLETPRGMVSFTNVHLATTRDGLSAVMHSAWKGGPALAARSRERGLEAEIARDWSARSSAPSLVAGDFNTPVESAVYRRTWSPFTNAFSTAGLGFGSTKHTRWHGVRIDHILAGPGWEVLRAWVGPDLGGDHRPMFADLRLTAP
ncbi:MAG: endonuclease/exonuclease/phosphatase family protein [Minicystis sp.]